MKARLGTNITACTFQMFRYRRIYLFRCTDHLTGRWFDFIPAGGKNKIVRESGPT